MARILLADDDQATRELVKRALESDGHQVEVTQDGAEALERLKSDAGTVDVLVSDVHMPGLDGIALAERAIGAVPALKILFMSGFTEQLERARKVEAKRLGVLSKPFTLEQIRVSVRALLD
jgi:CheY-like chemotaxis protein